MKKNKKNTQSVLLDLHYKYPKNTFEEFYGYSISYASVEQVSYIDLKDMAFDSINRGIKFRKFGRDKGILTVKMDVTPEELSEFIGILEGEIIDDEATNDENKNPDGKIKYKRFNFLHDFVITNVRDLTNKERIRFKKAIVESEDDAEEELEDEINENDEDND